MRFTGGDIKEIRFNHPTIGSGVLSAKAGEDVSLELGGPRSSDDNGGITGAGDMIDVMNYKRGEFSCTLAWDATLQETLEKVSKMCADPVLAVWNITHISGVVYRGSAKPVGDYTGNLNTATIPLKLQGSKFNKI